MRDHDWAVLLLMGVASLILYMQPKEVNAAASDVCRAYSQGAVEAHKEVGNGKVPIEALRAFQRDSNPAQKGSLALAFYKGYSDRVYQSASIDKGTPLEMVGDSFLEDCIKMVYIFEMNRVGR